MGGYEEETGISLMSILVQVRGSLQQNMHIATLQLLLVLGQFDRTITQVTRDSESMRGGTRQGRTLLYVSVCFVFV
jgi:hypothetical protein